MRDNNFDFLRFFAATLVFFSHCYPLYGMGGEPVYALTQGLIKGGGLGVSIFFVISGFLITASWVRSPSLSTYVVNRCLRIFPALIVVVCLTVIVLGLSTTTVSWQAYLTDSTTYSYLLNIFLLSEFTQLPGVFANNPLPYNVNGSLWTLALEAFMYLFIALLGLMRCLRPSVLIVCIAVMMWVFFYHTSRGMLWEWGVVLPLYFAARHVILFLLGALLYFIYVRYSVSSWVKVFLCILSLSILSVMLGTDYAVITFLLTLPVIVLAFSLLPLAGLKHAGKWGDFSYGIYIYAFPIQQWMRSVWPEDGSFWVYMAVSYLLVLICAILSWHGIEKYALRQKRHSIQHGKSH